MKNIVKITAIGLCAVMLQSCGTVFSGTSQTINVKVVDQKTQETVDNAQCIVTGSNGMAQPLNTNPGTVVVSRDSAPLVINCNKKGYRQVNTAVGDSFNAVTLVNVLFWPGFIVDAVTGAYKKLPSHYVVYMEKSAS